MENGEMAICDTNIVIELFKNNQQIKERLKEIGTQNLAISAITVGEFYFGALDKNEMSRIIKHIQHYTLLDLTPEITHTFISLMQKYSLSHKPFIGDMLIAATSIFHNVDLYTLNTKDFQFIPDLKLLEL